MPLEVKDVEWSETDTHVTIKVPLKGIKTSNVDIVSADQYLKVSFPPYIYEVFLFAVVEEQPSKATLGNGVATFSLLKREAGIWGQLQSSEIKSAEYKTTEREKAWAYNRKKSEEKKKQTAEEYDHNKKLAVREQIKLEQEERKERDQLKDDERERAIAELEQWKETKESEQSAYGELVDVPAKSSLKNSNPAQSIFPEENPLEEGQSIPSPRKSGTIKVSFTSRVFPTPSRESKAAEEKAWLEKVAAMSKIKENKDATDMEEMNPVWLKEKGDGFYKQGNFVAAINAYTAGIVLDGSIPSLYANRSACHLHMKQYNECIQDCSMALELLSPPVQANQESRCRSLIRRGTAYFCLEEYVLALKDYEDGLILSPHNTHVREDAEKIRRIIQGTN